MGKPSTIDPYPHIQIFGFLTSHALLHHPTHPQDTTTLYLDSCSHDSTLNTYLKKSPLSQTHAHRHTRTHARTQIPWILGSSPEDLSPSQEKYPVFQNSFPPPYPPGLQTRARTHTHNNLAPYDFTTHLQPPHWNNWHLHPHHHPSPKHRTLPEPL